MARHESLLPREHGAYAEIAFPLLTGMTMGKTTLAAICFALSAVSFFLMHEPVAVLIGVRGARAKESWRGRAQRHAIWLAAAGACMGAAALILAPFEGRLAALVPLTAGTVLLPAFLSGRLKTLTSEVLVIGALTGTLLPMSVSSGVAWPRAWIASGIWFVTFLIGTLTVHAIKARTGKGVGTNWLVTATPTFSAATIAVGLLAAATSQLPLTASLALALAGSVGVVSSITAVHPRRLKRVGWTFVAWNVITWALLSAM